MSRTFDDSGKEGGSVPPDTIPPDTMIDTMMNTIAESVIQVSDQQILSEVEESGRDSFEAASRVRDVLRGSVKSYRQRELFQALETYHREVAAIREKRFLFPATPEGKRELLASVFQRYPQMQNTFLTVQHRDFKNLPDEDIESFLKQLKMLGALGEEHEEGKE